MARAEVTTTVASKLTTGEKTFYKDKPTIITDEEEIALFKKNPSFHVREIKIAELAKEAAPVDSFTDYKEPEDTEYKYHDLMGMKKSELAEIAYEMGADTNDDSKKKELVTAILNKQGNYDSISS